MSAPSSDITIRELGAEELPSILPLIEQHNSKLTPEEVHRRFDAMIPHGYKCVAAFQAGRMVGVAGYWVGAKFWCGEFLEADNVYVLPELRSAGIGAKLMDYLEEKARQLGCKLVVLDSYVTYHGAHKFYIRRGYEITGYHFTRQVPDAREGEGAASRDLDHQDFSSMPFWKMGREVKQPACRGVLSACTLDLSRGFLQRR